MTDSKTQIEHLRNIADKIEAGEEPSFVIVAIEDESDNEINMSCAVHVKGMLNNAHIIHGLDDAKEKMIKFLAQRDEDIIAA